MSRHQYGRWLPEEVVVKIFNAKSADGDTVLDLQDRLRNMAVCKAWRSWLDHPKWPIQACCLEGGNAKLAEWLIQIKPEVHKMQIDYNDEDDSSEDEEAEFNVEHQHSAVINNVLLSLNPRAALVELKLFCDPFLVEDSLLGSFSNLTSLHLSGSEFGETMDSKFLCSLSMLVELQVSHWGDVRLLPATLGASTLLPNLQHLEVDNIQELLLDVALPRLQALDVAGIREVEVGGEHLQLPALTRLSLGGGDFEEEDGPFEVEVDMGRLTALQELSLRGAVLPLLDGLAPLHRLASLQLECYDSDQQEAAEELLRSAPQSLRQLKIGVFQGEHGNQVLCPLLPGLAAASCVSTHLTALTLQASGRVPARLGALTRLQALCLSSHPEELSFVEMLRLGQLQQLQRLVLAASEVEVGEEATVQGALKRLGGALPTGCIVELE